MSPIHSARGGERRDQAAAFKWWRGLGPAIGRVRRARWGVRRGAHAFSNIKLGYRCHCAWQKRSGVRRTRVCAHRRTARCAIKAAAPQQQSAFKIVCLNYGAATTASCRRRSSTAGMSKRCTRNRSTPPLDWPPFSRLANTDHTLATVTPKAFKSLHLP